MNRALITLMVGLPGCSGADDNAGDASVDDTLVSETDAGGLRLELGTGDRTYEPLDELDDVTLWWGTQGGYHMLGGFKVCGMNEYQKVDFNIVDESTGTKMVGEQGSGSHFDQIALVDEQPGCHQMSGLLSRLTNISELESSVLHTFMLGRIVEFQLFVSDTDGNEASATKRLTVSCGQNDECIPKSVDTDE